MNIGIVGSGAVGSTLGRLWSSAGHQVMFSSRHPDRLHDLTASLGASACAGTPEEAVAFGEFTLLAVNYLGIDEIALRLRDLIVGKVIIDATNPLVLLADGSLKRVIGEHDLALAVMMSKLPGARLVKAFTTMWTGYLEQNAHRGGDRAAVPYASDDMPAGELARQLISDAGFEPVALGGLADSRPLDPPSPIWNKVLTAQEIWQRIGRVAVTSKEAERA